MPTPRRFTGRKLRYSRSPRARIERTPLWTVQRATTRPPERTSSAAGYRCGEGGDHSRGWRSVRLPVNSFAREPTVPLPRFRRLPANTPATETGTEPLVPWTVADSRTFAAHARQRIVGRETTEAMGARSSRIR